VCRRGLGAGRLGQEARKRHPSRQPHPAPPQGMSNGGSGMLLPHVSTDLKSKWSNRCEEYWFNPWHFLSSSKAALVSLFPSHLFPSLFTFCVEEAASCRRDRLSKSISSKPKLDHPNLAKAARQHPWGYALYISHEPYLSQTPSLLQASFPQNN
jgi:hypothetical protein